MPQTITDICICKHYHAEDDTCGFEIDMMKKFGEYLDLLFIEESKTCNHVECIHGNYVELLPPQQPDGFDNIMIDRYGNVNWRLAFSMP